MIRFYFLPLILLLCLGCDAQEQKQASTTKLPPDSLFLYPKQFLLQTFSDSLPYQNLAHLGCQSYWQADSVKFFLEHRYESPRKDVDIRLYTPTYGFMYCDSFPPGDSRPSFEFQDGTELRKPDSLNDNILVVNGEAFRLPSEPAVPANIHYFEFGQEEYIALIRPYNMANGAETRYAFVDLLSLTKPIRYAHFEGEYLSMALLNDWNGDGLLDFPVMDTVSCEPCQNLCEERRESSGFICQRIRFVSLYEDGWRDFQLDEEYGIWVLKDDYLYGGVVEMKRKAINMSNSAHKE